MIQYWQSSRAFTTAFCSSSILYTNICFRWLFHGPLETLEEVLTFSYRNYYKLCYSHGRFCNIGLPRFGRKTFMIYCTRWHFLVVVEMNRVITRGRQNLHQGFNGRPFQSACVLFRTSSFQLLQTWLHARHST